MTKWYQYFMVLVAVSICFGSVSKMLGLPLWVAALCGAVAGFLLPPPVKTKKRKRPAPRRKAEQS